MVAKLLETNGVRHTQVHVRNAAAHALLKVVEGAGVKAAHFLYIVGRFIPGTIQCCRGCTTVQYSTVHKLDCGCVCLLPFISKDV